MPPHYDSLIAKLIVHHRTRDMAIARMQRALDAFIVEGIETSVQLHQRVLAEDDFMAGNLSTRFMETLQQPSRRSSETKSASRAARRGVANTARASVMPFSLPKLYPITDTSISGVSHAEQIERLAAGGASLIQLREKHASPREFYQAALEAMIVAKSLRVQLVINDRVDIAIAVKADGVHLGQEDLPPGKARMLLGRGPNNRLFHAYPGSGSGSRFCAGRLYRDWSGVPDLD